MLGDQTHMSRISFVAPSDLSEIQIPLSPVPVKIVTRSRRGKKTGNYFFYHEMTFSYSATTTW